MSKEEDCIIAPHECNSPGYDRAPDPEDPNKIVASVFQDKKYGKGKRVFNPSKVGYRCTICSRVK